MPVVQEYIQSLPPTERDLLQHMVDIVYEMVPNADEVISYGMPALSYDGKPFMAIIMNQRFLSLYPFCNHERLGLDLTAHECTKGSIHFTPDNLIPDEALRNIVRSRLALT